MSVTNSSCSSDVPKIFPKLFAGDAFKAFVKFLNKHNYNYKIYHINSLNDLINVFNSYNDYASPLIISDISILNKDEQISLLKLIDNCKFNLILLASKDNIISSIISRIAEYRKYYVFTEKDKCVFANPKTARESLSDEFQNYDSKLKQYNKTSPIMLYDELLVRSCKSYLSKKILNILEH